MNIKMNSNDLMVHTTNVVSYPKTIEIAGTNSQLNTSVSADFTNVPRHLHQLYLQAFIGLMNSEKTEPIHTKKSVSRMDRLAEIFLNKIR